MVSSARGCLAGVAARERYRDTRRNICRHSPVRKVQHVALVSARFLWVQSVSLGPEIDVLPSLPAAELLWPWTRLDRLGGHGVGGEGVVPGRVAQFDRETWGMGEYRLVTAWGDHGDVFRATG